MEQEDKDLLLKDLLPRLAHGVKFKLTDIGIFNMDAEYGVNQKAYRPMNMTNFYHCSTDPRFELEEDSGYGVGEIEIDEFVPIYFPLSALTKEITRNGETSVPIENLCQHARENRSVIGTTRTSIELMTDYPIETWPLWVIEKLNEWHIDYRGLIERGLAVSVYELDKNPYE